MAIKLLSSRAPILACSGTAVLALSLGALSTAQAEECDWRGGDGLFGNPKLWDPGVPLPDDIAVFQTEGLYTVTFNFDPTTDGLRIDDGYVHFDVLDTLCQSGHDLYTLTGDVLVQAGPFEGLSVYGLDLDIGGELRIEEGSAFRMFESPGVCGASYVDIAGPTHIGAMTNGMMSVGQGAKLTTHDLTTLAVSPTAQASLDLYGTWRAENDILLGGTAREPGGTARITLHGAAELYTDGLLMIGPTSKVELGASDELGTDRLGISAGGRLIAGPDSSIATNRLQFAEPSLGLGGNFEIGADHAASPPDIVIPVTKTLTVDERLQISQGDVEPAVMTVQGTVFAGATDVWPEARLVVEGDQAFMSTGPLDIGAPKAPTAARDECVESATITVRSGASLVSAGAEIAEHGLTITDPGSSWLNTGPTLVCEDGLLLVADGAEAFTNEITLAPCNDYEHAAAHVTGDGACLMVKGPVAVGGDFKGLFDGTASLTIEDGAYAEIRDYLQLWTHATVELRGGELRTPLVHNQVEGDFLFLGGRLVVGEFQGALTNEAGTLVPTAPYGVMPIDGAYTQLAKAALEVEIHGAEPALYDALDVSGPVELGGTLVVQGPPVYVPDVSEFFEIIKGQEINGYFANAYPDFFSDPYVLFPGGRMFVYYGATSVYLYHFQPCEADIDGDGQVGFGDLPPLLSAWGPCEGCIEDTDGDGIVGFTDLTALLAGWGECPFTQPEG